MSSALDSYMRSQHGELGIGKRPSELNWVRAAPFDVTPEEASRLLHVSPNTIRNWVQSGRLVAEQRKLRWYLRRPDVIALRKEQAS